VGWKSSSWGSQRCSTDCLHATLSGLQITASYLLHSGQGVVTAPQPLLAPVVLFHHGHSFTVSLLKLHRDLTG
jgi:hypothetical protein